MPFGTLNRSMNLPGVLGRQNKERLRKFTVNTAGGYPMLLHGLQQGALCLGRRTVDLISQNNVRENRPFHKFKLATFSDEELYDFRNYFTPSGHHVKIKSIPKPQYGEKGDVKIWDADSGAELCIMSGNSDKVKAVAAFADGKRIMCVGAQSKYYGATTTVKVWKWDRFVPQKEFMIYY